MPSGNAPLAADAFTGTKLLLFIGAALYVQRRDWHVPIPWPGYLDFPGGGREIGETPEACVLRETREETGLDLAPDALIWKAPRDGARGRSWFFAAHLPEAAHRDIRFGDEGLGWALIPPRAYLWRADAIPEFKPLLARYLGERLSD